MGGAKVVDALTTTLSAFAPLVGEIVAEKGKAQRQAKFLVRHIGVGNLDAADLEHLLGRSSLPRGTASPSVLQNKLSVYFPGHMAREEPSMKSKCALELASSQGMLFQGLGTLDPFP